MLPRASGRILTRGCIYLFLVSLVFTRILFLFSLFTIVLGNKKSKKTGRKGTKTKRQKFSDDEDRIAIPTSTQDVEFEKLIKRLVELHVEVKEGLTPVPEKDNLAATSMNLCDAIGKQLVNEIDWAKGLPGYETLTLNDQAILLQSGWIEMLLLNWIYYSLPLTDSIRFASDVIVDGKTASALSLDPVSNQLRSLVARVQTYGMDEEEFVCLKAVGLMNAGMRYVRIVTYSYTSFVADRYCPRGQS